MSDGSDVDRLHLRCACGWYWRLATPAEFPEGFEALKKHLNHKHSARTAVAMAMEVTVTEPGQ